MLFNFLRDFRGLSGEKNPCLFSGFPCLFPKKKKNKERKIRVLPWERGPFSVKTPWIPRGPEVILQTRKPQKFKDTEDPDVPFLVFLDFLAFLFC